MYKKKHDFWPNFRKFVLAILSINSTFLKQNTQILYIKKKLRVKYFFGQAVFENVTYLRFIQRNN